MSLLLCFLLYVQPLTGPELPLGVPQLQIQKGDKTPSQITQLKYQIEVLGFLSQTTVTVRLEDADRFNQEASLLVQLPPHSTVDGFQLNIGDTMVDGVIQEKNLARIGFDREKRKRVDPGLIEWVGHNLYRIRVFPLRAKLPRTISFRYLAPLIADKGADTYSLDLSGLSSTTKVSIALEQLDGATPPTVLGKAKEKFTATQNGLHWKLMEKFSFSNPLVFRWEQGLRATTLIGQGESEWHFALRSTVAPSQGKLLANPSAVAVFWDASHSRSARAVQQEIDAIFRLIAFRNPDSLHLIPFRDVQEPHQSFDLSQDGKAALRKTLESQIYDGGTNLRGLQLPPNLAIGEIWLFSDGQDSLGMEETQSFGGVPAFAFSTAPRANWPYLDSLAQRHGGQALFWDSPEESQLQNTFQSNRAYPEAITTKKGALLETHQVFAAATHEIFAGGQALDKPQDFAMKVGTVSQKILGNALQVPAAHLSWLTRFTAGRRLDTLHQEPDFYREDILALGEDHGFVSQHTTLIVFETLEQYAANGLTPPANAPFDASNIPDRAPTQESLAKLKASYFSTAARGWNVFHGPKIPAEKKMHSGTVLTTEELKPLPKARDPWAVLDTIPRIQFDRINIGGNEAGNSEASQSANFMGNPGSSSDGAWIIDGVEFTDSSNGASSAYIDFGSFSQLENTFSSNPQKPLPRPTLKPWNQIEAAIAEIKKSNNLYASYLALKSQYDASPAFFYQTAHLLAGAGQPELARRVATNLLEQGWQDDRLLFAAGMLCHSIQDLETAGAIYTKLARQRPEWPHPRMLVAQIHREKGIALETTDKDASKAAFLEAFELYQGLVLAPWGELDEWEQAAFLRENRFPRILVTIVEEGFWLQQKLALLGQTVNLKLPEGFEATPDQILADVRVLMWWDDENADLALWISEPDGISTNFFTNPTEISGRIIDEVRGLGPDNYAIRSARQGVFKIEVRHFGSLFSQLMGPIYVKTELWTRYGHPDEAYRVQLNRIDKSDKSSMILLDEVTWPGK